METLFAGIDLGAVSVSMTINAPAAIMLAFYVVAAEENGVPADRLGGTIQADILKEYIAQEGVVLPSRSGDAAARRHDRVVCRAMPRWHPVSITAATKFARAARRRRRSCVVTQKGTPDPPSSRPSSAGSTCDDFVARRLSCLLQSRTSTSSRRSRSTGAPAGSGPASCATRSARDRGRG
jgi:hypothetical protein